MDQLFPTPVRPRDSDERYTPAWVFDGLGITFDLDPCSPVDGGDCVPARERYTAQDDGLSRRWDHASTVWVNPPFSNAAAFCDRFIAHGHGVFLGPVANSKWTQRLLAAGGLYWLCEDFAFTHPTHAGKRSSMPLLFAGLGRGVTPLRRLARSGVAPWRDTGGGAVTPPRYIVACQIKRAPWRDTGGGAVTPPRDIVTANGPIWVVMKRYDHASGGYWYSRYCNPDDNSKLAADIICRHLNTVDGDS